MLADSFELIIDFYGLPTVIEFCESHTSMLL